MKNCFGPETNLASAPAVIHTFKETHVLKAKNYSPGVAFTFPVTSISSPAPTNPPSLFGMRRQVQVILGPDQLTPKHEAPRDVV